MKKTIAFFAILFTAQSAFSQWQYTGAGTTGNIYNTANPKVGIGNSAPTTLLDVGNTTKSTAAESAHPSAQVLGLQTRTAGTAAFYGYTGNLFYTSNSYSAGSTTGFSNWTSVTGSQNTLNGLKSTIEILPGGSASGSVGISSLLNISGTYGITDYKSIYSQINNTGTGAVYQAYGLFLAPPIGNVTNSYAIYAAAGSGKSYFADRVYCGTKLSIGTDDPVKIGSYALAVNGDAIFNRVKVKLYANWPDYVFDKNYKLLPLEDVEKFIQTNKHLPNVPNAETMQKEGIDVGTTSSMQMQKLEELTLYLIEQNKKIESQNKKIEELQAKLDKLVQ